MSGGGLFLVLWKIYFNAYTKVVKLLLLLLLCFVIFIPLIKISEKEISETHQIPARDIKTSESQYNLSEPLIRHKITKALHAGKISEAITTIRRMKNDELKGEERERIFFYCIKNHKLNEAKDVANECWEDVQKEKAFSVIAREEIIKAPEVIEETIEDVIVPEPTPAPIPKEPETTPQIPATNPPNS